MENGFYQRVSDGSMYFIDIQGGGDELRPLSTKENIKVTEKSAQEFVRFSGIIQVRDLINLLPESESKRAFIYPIHGAYELIMFEMRDVVADEEFKDETVWIEQFYTLRMVNRRWTLDTSAHDWYCSQDLEMSELFRLDLSFKNMVGLDTKIHVF